MGAFFANWSAWKAMDSFFESSNANFILVCIKLFLATCVEDVSTAKRMHIKSSEKTNKNNAFGGTLSLQTLSFYPQQRDVILCTSFVFNYTEKNEF